MNQAVFANLLCYRALDAKPHLTPDEESLLEYLHHTLVGQYDDLMPPLSDIILAYRKMLGDGNEGLDGDECENLTDIIRMLINDHEGNL